MTIALIIVSCALLAGLIALFVTVQIRWRRTYPKTLPNGEIREKQSFKEWIKNHIPSKRKFIQVYTALLYNANIKGFASGNIYQSETTKYACVPGLNCYSCPGAVGACPMGAFQNALAESKTSFPYYILGILALFGLAFARSICGFLCPVGLGQELLYKARTPKLKKSRVTRVFSYFKYVILAVLAIAIPLVYAVWNMPLPGFCKYICPAGTFGGAIMLLIHPSNANLYTTLGPLFTWKFCVLIAVIVASIFIYRFFCRFFCPLGAIYGFFNRIALLGVTVDEEDCIDCGKCVAACKMDVKRVGDHECINCGECMSLCPTKAIRWKGSKLFLRGAAAATAETKTETAKPLNFSNGTIQIVPVTAMAAQADSTAVMQETTNIVTEPEPFNDAASANQNTQTNKAEQANEQTTPKAQKKRGKSFWLQLSAAILALVVLIGALVYYNFIDVEKKETPENPDIGYEVGQTAPDFTIQLYDHDGNPNVGSYTLYENRGKLTVLNFWATWCTGCVAELPYFNELSANHTEWTVIAIHGNASLGDKGSASDYIAANYSDWTLTFAQDNLEGIKCLTYELLGGRGTWPITVIVDEKGIVVYNSPQPFHSYAQLEQLVLSFTA